MDLDELKKTWKQVNRDQSVHYSLDQIDTFRKSRSKDFSNWIRSSLRIDFILKSLTAISFAILVFLFNNQIQVQVICGILAILSTLLIFLEKPHFDKARKLDENPDTIQGSLINKLNYLKAYYFKIQFMVGLTNPLMVSAGACYFMYFKYSEIRPMDLEDILVFGAILIVSFLFTIPTTLGLYGFHLRNIQNSLANLENEDHWEKEIKRYKRSRNILAGVFITLLLIGILALIVILLR